MKVTNTDHTAIWLSHEISDEPLLIYRARIINPSVIEAVFPDSLNTIYGLPQIGIRQRSVVCEDSGTNYLSMLLCTD